MYRWSQSTLPIESGAADAVLVENFEGARSATEHLIGHGYTRILCLGGWRELKTTTDRIAGYKAAMTEGGLPSLVRDAAIDYESTRAVLQKLKDDGELPQAILTLNQITTEFTWEVLDAMDVRIPSDTAVIGFDDFRMASLLTPQLTVVRQPASELGQRAARLLFERIDSTEEQLKFTTVLPTATGDPAVLRLRPTKKRQISLVDKTGDETRSGAVR